MTDNSENPFEISTSSNSGLAGSSELGVNDAGTCADSDPPVTQACSQPVLGHVYFIRAGEAIKIGFSKNAPSRLAALQTSNPEHLTLMGSFKGAREDEQELHVRFCHLRIRGEWFRDEDELVEFIEDKTWEEPKLPPPSRETRLAIAKIIKSRAAYGANTPIGHRHSNLAGQIRHYEFAEGERKQLLAGYISRSLREIEGLRASILQ